MVEPTIHESCAPWWGAGSVDERFGRQVKVTLPWPVAGRPKSLVHGVHTLTETQVASPVWLAEVDPRTLWASQPWIVREHVAYYLTGEWERTGVTSADRHLLGNRWPAIVVDHLGRPVIRAGHHRATAALLRGRPLLARLFPSDPDGAEAVLPCLLLGARTRVSDVVECSSVEDALAVARSGGRVLSGDPALVATVADVLSPLHRK